MLLPAPCPIPLLQNLYVDMQQVVQMHVSIEEIGMRSTRWSTVSSGVRHRCPPACAPGPPLPK